MKLSDDQFAMLRRTAEEPVSYEDLSDDDVKVLQYLSRLKYVRIDNDSHIHSQDGFSAIVHTPKSASITELGKSVLSEISEDKARFKKTHRLDLIALIISGIALAISLISLLHQFL